MSGGTYNYFYGKLEDLACDIRTDGDCDSAPPHMREALRVHLLKLARVLRAVERNDSGDGDREETRLLQELISPADILEAAVQRAEEVKLDLEDGIETARKLLHPEEKFNSPKSDYLGW